MRDPRDPLCVGNKLLSLAEAKRKTHPELKLSEIADKGGLNCPPWTGDGLMSSNPANHHSKTPQDVGTRSGSASSPGFPE